MTGKWSTDPEVLEKEVVWSFFRGGGPGGQHRNKVETGVRLFHPPSGITVTATEGRSQYRNREVAMERLIAALKKRMHKRKKRIATKPTKGSKKRRVDAKKQRGQHRHDKRRDECHRHRIGQRHEIEADDEECCRPCGNHAPGDLKRPKICLQDTAPMIDDQQQNTDDKTDLPQPDDLQGREMICQIFRLCVNGGKDEHAGQHEHAAPDIVDGSPCRAAGRVRSVRIVAPAAIRRGTCHGRRCLICFLASIHSGPERREPHARPA